MLSMIFCHLEFAYLLLCLMVIFCRAKVFMSAEEFRCGSGLCIPISWQCDGEKDCPNDGLDEWDQLCRKEKCKEGDFRCEVESTCIPQGWQCDGIYDCMDGSDE